MFLETTILYLPNIGLLPFISHVCFSIIIIFVLLALFVKSRNRRKSSVILHAIPIPPSRSHVTINEYVIGGVVIFIYYINVFIRFR